LSKHYLLVKRSLDFLLAAALWLLLSPLQVAIALLIKVTSPGPVFYPWKVVGK
jgi:lipopolysaccharide/colanic/teichoic acid biosynthesis glycosyltransferase